MFLRCAVVLIILVTQDYVCMEDVIRASLLALEGEWDGLPASNLIMGLSTNVT